MTIAYLTLHLHLPDCQSLKDKRSRIKSLLSQLHKKFNVSAAEIGLNDRWQECLVGCALVSNDNGHAHRALQRVVEFIPAYFPNIEIIDFRIENV
jgi:hypothetical protein